MFPCLSTELFICSQMIVNKLNVLVELRPDIPGDKFSVLVCTKLLSQLARTATSSCTGMEKNKILKATGLKIMSKAEKNKQ